MWCAFYKRRISRSLDSGTPPGALTRRHLARCGSCREYARFAEKLGKRLTKDAAAAVESAGAALGEKVSAALGRRAGSPSLSRPRPIRLKPALTAAGLLGVVGITLIWVLTPRPAGIPPLDPLFDLARPQVHLANAAIKAESPLQEEILEWKQAFISAADYLKAKLDIKLGE
jgi:hypothetical protein